MRLSNVSGWEGEGIRVPGVGTQQTKVRGGRAKRTVGSVRVTSWKKEVPAGSGEEDTVWLWTRFERAWKLTFWAVREGF